MNAPLTPARLSEIRARVGSATTGPWETMHALFSDDKHIGQAGSRTDIAHDAQAEDAEFIAAARQDVPNLLAEVDRLTAALDVAEKAIKASWNADNYPKAMSYLSNYDAAKESQG